MPRVKKKVEMIPTEAPSTDLALYTSADTGVIKFGVLLWQKSNKGKEQTELPTLSPEQITFLNMRVAGISPDYACKAIGIDSLSPLYWEESEGKDSLYCKCVEALSLKQVKDAENTVWDAVAKDSSSRRDILRMFAIKAKLPEYRDNAPTVSAPVTVHLSFGNRQYLPETDTSKIIEEMQNE
jgi:hypothetical protein